MTEDCFTAPRARADVGAAATVVVMEPTTRADAAGTDVPAAGADGAVAPDMGDAVGLRSLAADAGVGGTLATVWEWALESERRGSMEEPEVA
jgi:hypothetical protein